METTIDVPRLFAVLDDRVTTDGISWRQAAGLIGVSPSLLSRLRNGQRPDLDAYAKIVRWLGLSADEFLRDTGDGTPQPELTTQVSALLRARTDLGEDDKKYLEEIFRSSLVHVRKSRSAEK
jgi:transcriptional regulator with XRE-family HTH domain